MLISSLSSDVVYIYHANEVAEEDAILYRLTFETGWLLMPDINVNLLEE